MNAIDHLFEAEKHLEKAEQLLRMDGYRVQASEIRSKLADIRRIREIIEEETAGS